MFGEEPVFANNAEWPKHSGNTAIRQHFNNTIKFANFYQFTDRDVLRNLGKGLPPELLPYYTEKLKEDPKITLKTMISFLKMQWCPAEKRIFAANMLAHLKQGCDGVQEFANAVEHWSHEAYPDLPQESWNRMCLAHFHKGLSLKYKTDVLGHKSNNFKEAVKCAKKVELLAFNPDSYNIKYVMNQVSDDDEDENTDEIMNVVEEFFVNSVISDPNSEEKVDVVEDTRKKLSKTRLTIVTKFLSLLGGGKRKSNVDRNQDGDFPEELLLISYAYVAREDIASVSNNEEPTKIAIFRILHHLVQSYNDSVGRNEISLMHYGYVDEVQDLVLRRKGTVSPTTYHCFRSEENERILIPVLAQHHYILIDVRRYAKGKTKIYVFDSSLKNEAFAKESTVKLMARYLDFNIEDDPPVLYAKENDIIKQTEKENSGIHLLQNVQALLNNPKNDGSNLQKFYPSNVTELTMIGQRKELANLLEIVTGLQPEESKRLRMGTNDSEKIVQEGNDDDLCVQLVGKDDSNGMWIVVKSSENLIDQLNTESWLERKCICSMKIKSDLETVERDPKFVVITKCGGTIRSLHSLANESNKNIKECGAKDMVDLIITRLTGINVPNWKTISSWNRVGVCTDHVNELGYHFFSNNSRSFKHVNTLKKNLGVCVACSWPKDSPRAHTGERPEKKTTITKDESFEILKAEGYFLPPGLPVCDAHKNAAASFIERKNSQTTPRQTPSKTTPRSKSSNSRTRGLRNSKSPASTSKTSDILCTPKLASKYKARKKLGLPAAVNNLTDKTTIEKAVCNIERLVDIEFGKILTRLKRNLTADIIPLKNETHDEYAIRVLGRIQFHLSNKHAKTDDNVNICDVFPMLYRKFMGIGADEDEEDEDENEDEDEDEDEKTTKLNEPTPIDVESDDDNQENEEPIDQFVPGETEEMEIENMPKIKEEVELELEENIADIMGPELRLAEQDSKDVAKKVTFVRLCDSRCKKLLPGAASFVTDKLLELCYAKNFAEQDEMLEMMTSDKFSNIKSTIYDWIENHGECYQGLRSIGKRLKELNRLSTLKGHIKAAKDGSEADIERVIGMDFMPDELMLQYNRLFAEKKSITHHTQSAVEKKFGHLRKAFEEKMADTEDKICDICTQLTVRSEVSKKNTNEVKDRFLIAANRGKPYYNVCRMCWREMRMNKMPHGALANRMESDDEPEALKCLNQIERMLIQRVRAIQKIFHLRDIGGRKTEMPATAGVLTLVPVAIESTIEHVADTLPNAAGMVIHVATPWEKVHLVSMKKIVNALTWLKENNRHYGNIEIDERFTFVLGINILLEKQQANDTDVERMILRSGANDDHLLTQADFEVQPFREIIPFVENDEPAYEKYILKKDKYRRMSNDVEYLDELTFPGIYPKGRFGLSDKRSRKTTLTKFVRHRLLEENRKYATNANYYSFMYGLRSQQNMTSILGIQARIKKGAVTSDVHLDDPAFQATMNSITAKLRGSPAYWQAVRYELRSHVVNYGNPTFFLTLNSNETEWADLHQLYSNVSGQTINAKNIKSAIAADPTIYSRYWKRRVNSFFKEVLLVPDGPLGTITHYFHRVEYQHRGTQHVHCLLWTKERPTADASPSEITAFIDKYVTARLPSETDEPELFNVINKSQKHWDKHSKTCSRINKYRNHTIKRCRFDFPRPVLRRTAYYKDKMAMLLPGLNKREYFLARDDTDEMINDYNSAISLFWNGNTDVQVIMANSVGVCNYITSYTTKGEKAKKNADPIGLKISSSTAIQKDTFKMLHNMMNNRECGGLEIVDDLLGHKNFAFDKGHTFIQTDSSDRRTRCLKPAEQLKRQKSTDKCYVDNMLDDYYPNRSNKLKDFSLFNIMINFDVVASSRVAKRRLFPKRAQESDTSSDEDIDDNYEMDMTDEDYHYRNKFSPFYSHGDMENGEGIPFSSTKSFRKKKQTVARFFLPELDWSDIEIVEDFFRRLCLMFVPWDCEETMLQDRNCDSFLEMYERFREELRSKNATAADDLEKLVNSFLSLKKQDRLIAKHLDAIKKAEKELDINHDLNEEIEIQKRTVDESRHQQDISNMNAGQRDLFERIMKKIEDQQNNRDSREDFQLFISGTAGVGKSFLINALADELTLRYADPKNQGFRPAVLIAAPTGLAAIGVKGTTIHSLFSIEVQHGTDSPFSAMRDSARDLKRALFENVKLIIIDELSMCSNITLMKMSCRLQEIKAKSDLFGGVNIVAFGDLLQLTPVSAPCIFEGINAHQMRQIFAGISININLWSRFEYAELVQNMRQRDDLEFAELMGRVRLEAMTPEDVKVLKGRIIPTKSKEQIATFDEMAEFFVELQKKDAGALALFPTNAEVVEFNAKVMKLKRMNSTRIVATETAVASARERARGKQRKYRKIWQLKEYSITGKPKKSSEANEKLGTEMSPNIAGGLPLVLDVAVGARVMLRRNLDTPKGLVNGATGELTDIEVDINNYVTALFVKFDKDTTKITRIERVSVYYDVSFEERRSRNQFPIVMAFGATVHKAQGLTLKNVLVTTRNMFCAGQFFVGASRVQNISGLYLGDFHERKIMVHTKSLIEYNRLRKSIGMHEFLLPVALASDEKEYRRASGTIGIVVDKKIGKKKRATRTLGNEDEPTAHQLLNILPAIEEGCEFGPNEKQVMHAVLLCIVKMTNIRKGLIALRADDEKLTFQQLTLSELMKGGTKCIEYLMREIRENLASPTAMFEKCFEFLPAELKNVVQVEIRTEYTCLNCRYRKREDISTTVLEVDANMKCKSLETTINDPFELTVVKDACTKCKKEDSLERTRTIKFHEEHKYLIVVINGKQKQFNTLRQDGTFALDRRWTYIASVHNVGYEGQACYLACRDGGVVRVKKNEVGELKNRPPLRNLGVIVFQMKEYERKKKMNERRVEENIDDLLESPEKEEIETNRMKKANLGFYSSSDDTDSDDDEKSKRLLKLKNSGTDCFLICAVNLLNSMKDLRIGVLGTHARDEWITELVEILDGFRNQVAKLRKSLIPFNDNNQHDADHAFSFLLESMPEEMKKSFTVIRATETICSGKCEIVRSDDKDSKNRRVACFWYPDSGPSTRSTNIGSVEKRVELVKCQTCKANAEERSTYRVEPAVTNLIVSRQGVEPVNESKFAHPNVDAIVTLFGNNWKIKAMAEYRGDTSNRFGSAGHYVTWQSIGNSWIEINDDVHKRHGTSAVINLANCITYVLEKV